MHRCSVQLDHHNININIDKDECAEQTHNCSVDDRLECSNTLGSFSCVCKPGFTGDNCEGIATIHQCSYGIYAAQSCYNLHQ